MKLRRKWHYDGVTYSVQEAVHSDLLEQTGDGKLEDLDTQVQRCATFLATLTQKLRDRGILSTDEVIGLLRGGWESVE